MHGMHPLTARKGPPWHQTAGARTSTTGSLFTTQVKSRWGGMGWTARACSRSRRGPRAGSCTSRHTIVSLPRSSEEDASITASVTCAWAPGCIGSQH